jgi:hypothetical protein
MKTKKKTKKVKPRIKVAPPSKRHKTKKDYNRKENNKVADLVLEEEICQTPNWITEELCGCTPEKGFLDTDIKQELVEQIKDENKHAGSNFQEFIDKEIKKPRSLWERLLRWFK